jgi:transglutaminase-like putative cysteine protease
VVTFRIVHRTTYRYERQVTSGYSEVRLVPRTDGRQRRRSFDLAVDPMPSDRRARVDFFGNDTTYFEVATPHVQLTVTASSVVRVTSPEPQLTPSTPWERTVDDVRSGATEEWVDARLFTLDSPLARRAPELAAYAAPSFPPGRPALEAVLDLSGRIHRDFEFQPGSTTTTTPLLEVLAARTGVCQDFAQLLCGCVRSVGLPARYVSGYLETEAPPGAEKLVGVDASHAWASVFVPPAGWFDVDPTNDALPAERHVTVAVGRDYGDVPPLRGVVFTSGGDHELEVAVDVTRLPDGGGDPVR